MLKNGFGFDGFVVSDYTGIQELIMHGVAGNGADAAARRHQRRRRHGDGVDELRRLRHEAPVEGRITQREIDDAVRRILRIKFALGLFERPYVDVSGEVTAVSAAARAAARAAAGRSMVLLKNDGPLLPLKTAAKVAVIGPLAQATYDLNGCWSGLGTGSSTTPPVTVVDGITAAGATVTYALGCDIESTDKSGFDAAVAAAKAADVVVLALGESAAMSGEASARSDIDLPGVQQQLQAAIVAGGTPVVAVLFNGRPLTLQSTHDSVDAILECWAPGCGRRRRGRRCAVRTGQPRRQVAGVVPAGRRTGADLLQPPQHRASGRPEQQVHVEVPRPAQRAAVRLRFRAELHHVHVSNVRLSSTRMSRRGGHITVKVDVRNTGAVAGDEVVQLYLHDPVARISQPVRRLRGFRRVTLAPGQKRTLTLHPQHR